jgi:hypothetical protein
MGSARARLQHQAGHTADRNMRAHTALVHYNKCAIQNIQMAFFDKQNGEPLLDGDGLERGQEIGYGKY